MRQRTKVGRQHFQVPASLQQLHRKGVDQHFTDNKQQPYWFYAKIYAAILTDN